MWFSSRNGVILRFSRDDEALFKASLEPHVLRGGIGFFSLGAGMWLYYILSSYLGESDFQFSVADVRTFSFVVWLFALAVVLFVIILIALRLWKGWFLSLNWELVVLLCATSQGFCLAVGSAWIGTLICGRHPDDVWEQHVRIREGECARFLIQQAILTTFARYVPIRTWVLWILPLFGSVLYMVLSVGVGSATPSSFQQNAIVGCTSIFFTLHGAHRDEARKREEWQRSRRLQDVVQEQCTKIGQHETCIQALRRDLHQRDLRTSELTAKIRELKENTQKQQFGIGEREDKIRMLESEMRQQQVGVMREEVEIQELQDVHSQLREWLDEREAESKCSTTVWRSRKPSSVTKWGHFLILVEKCAPGAAESHAITSMATGRSSKYRIGKQLRHGYVRSAPMATEPSRRSSRVTCDNFDGDWTLVGGSDWETVAPWLRSFSIDGDRVFTQEGVIKLTKNERRETIFRRGVLSFHGVFLRRVGFSGRVLAFRRVVPTPRAIDDRRTSVTSFDGVFSARPVANDSADMSHWAAPGQVEFQGLA